MDPNLNKLLNWGIANSTPQPNGVTLPTNDTSSSLSTPSTAPSSTTPSAPRPLDPDVLASLFGGPSDADLMIASMQAITSPDPTITLDDRVVAFDNFEQLIENLDNANNLAACSLWTPLLEQLTNKEAELRKMAAWCVGTAVQNNEKSQERCLALGGVEALVKMCLDGEERVDVRRKAVYALSSEVRNYQSAMDVFVEELGKAGRKVSKTDASDMDATDSIINGLREEVAKSSVKA